MVKKKIAATTFGCKVNQYETSCILDDFIGAGFDVVDFNEPAEIYIINTCTVTNRTDYKSRNAIRKALREKGKNPDVKVIVTGCYSQRNVEEVRKLGDVDLIVGNDQKGKVLEFITDWERFNRVEAYPINDVLKSVEFEEISTNSMIDRTRAFIKIQDGCDYYCSFCAVPFARGHSRSRKKENVLDQIEKLVKNGFKEFVLGGINLGLYGREKEEKYFLSDLLFNIENIEGVELIRLSSIEPQLFTDDLIKFLKNSKKICPHLHIPLQAGCDELLKTMKRNYSTTEFVEVIQILHRTIPNLAIGIDVITGFPGETNELFNNTEKFLSELDFTYLHVFSYSRRPGTKAAEMKNQVNGRKINYRSNRLIDLSKNKTEKYLEKILKNKIVLSGIVENQIDGYWTALSDHYLRIYLKNNDNLLGKYLKFEPKEKKFNGVEVTMCKLRNS
ncbi:MAG: tRNA (N(6)-L-threonylcarbamoyladenosine(37)-C(2))-methylthiotransferase MtaB [Candidatus Cloacimonetes bacterium]|nr:tRNA (N(6)-L-threonylcarbamoyladenosine(37)-C(2))-methylthiotransferase MtaB [Candidatus Cloacimonadota bacterium]